MTMRNGKKARTWYVPPEIAQDVSDIALYARSVLDRFPGVRPHGKTRQDSVIVAACISVGLPVILARLRSAETADDVLWLVR